MARAIHNVNQQQPQAANLHKSITCRDGSQNADWRPLRCGHCGADVQAAVVADREGIRWLLCPRCHNGSVANDDVTSPPELAGLPVRGLPPDVASVYRQARDCFAVNAYTAVELVCRRLLMNVAVNKGAETGVTFAGYIEYLSEQGYVTPPMKKWVELIKEHGNEAAHELSEPSKTRAESTLIFTAELLRLIYEMEEMANTYAGSSE